VRGDAVDNRTSGSGAKSATIRALQSCRSRSSRDLQISSRREQGPWKPIPIGSCNSVGRGMSQTFAPLLKCVIHSVTRAQQLGAARFPALAGRGSASAPMRGLTYDVVCNLGTRKAQVVGSRS